MKLVEITLTPKQASDDIIVQEHVSKFLNVDSSEASNYRIVRRSIDARKRGDIKINMSLEVYIDEPLPEQKFEPNWIDISHKPSVIVVGSGPAGLFAALELIELGLRPIVIERGKSIDERKKDIADINRNEPVNSDSNYSFGEGGAGTYSDGKLYTRSKKRGSNRKALDIFCYHGALENILYDAHPHIGTDKLPHVIKSIRETIEHFGGKVLFNQRVTDLIIDSNSNVLGVETHTGDKIDAQAVILATGHSARDIYTLLHEKNIELLPKSFAVGVRVEHQQSLIDKIQYKGYKDEYLPSASYSLVTQVKGRGVFSFCMCPGGFIVPAQTDDNQCVVNGMSLSGRNNIYANSGIVTEVRAEDILDYTKYYGVLGGMKFQEQLEQLGHSNGGGAQISPSQLLSDFVTSRSSVEALPTSYHPGLVVSDMHRWLPRFISKSLQQGFKDFNNKMHGFITSEAQVVGIESRTSSPVRIPRDKDSCSHPHINGLFPCGEGAGYAGGIISAAIDGMHVAQGVRRFLL